MRLFTVGFTKKSAEEFFELLMKNGVKRIIDIRLNNKSQLAGFAKGDDLKYFLEKIGKIEYVYTSSTEEKKGSYVQASATLVKPNPEQGPSWGDRGPGMGEE